MKVSVNEYNLNYFHKIFFFMFCLILFSSLSFSSNKKTSTNLNSESKYIVSSLKSNNENMSAKKQTIRRKHFDKYIYDEANRLIRVDSFDKGLFHITYDEYGRKKTESYGISEYKNYYYDILNRITKIEFFKGKNREEILYKYSTLATSYKLGHQIEKIEKNEHSFYKYKGGRLIEERKNIKDNNFITKYEYNARHLVSLIQYPSGVILFYEYNDENKVSRILLKKGASTKEIFSIKNIENGGFANFGNGLKKEWMFNREKNELIVKTEGIQEYRVKYNAKGLISRVIDKINPRNRKEFFYDRYERLITAYGPWGKISYRYDDMDNLVQKDENDKILRLVYEKKSSKIKKLIENEKDIAIKYNELGRMTTYKNMQYKYGVRGRLEKIQENGQIVSELIYNIKNQRIIEKNNKNECYYIYDLDDKVIAQYSDSGKVLKQYIYIGDIPIAFLANNEIYYYHYDMMNFPNRISDANGSIVNEVEYKPFGEIISIKGSIKDDYLFPGQYKILDTPLYYNLNRTYLPELGKYLEPDPILNHENKYQYSKGNPILNYDLKGLQSGWDVDGVLNCYNLQLTFRVGSIFFYTYLKITGNYVKSCDCFQYDRYGTGEVMKERLNWGWFVARLHCIGINKSYESIWLSHSTFDAKGTSIQKKFAYPQVKEFLGEVDYGSITVTNPLSSKETASLTGLTIGNVKLEIDLFSDYFRTQDWSAQVSMNFLDFLGGCRSYNPGEYTCCK